MKKRRPYITCESEQRLFDDHAKSHICAKRDLTFRYSKEFHEHYFKTMDDLTFRDINLWMCNDDLRWIAVNSAAWLHLFIALGAISAEYSEKVDFVEDEIRDIITNNHMERLKDRLWPEDYEAMEKDLEHAGRFNGVI
jgi:hypothetical protein